ncbi:hypothetical protein Ait01nite_065950 [Actinoplanes italicus]|uniref:Uncharacterized protein DUF3152 n=1 Tax=Actinoplanes italicus TaxID=113567 RepID=A0A2T0KQF5_9ACTN|nr:DUF3152 domain-containing protein [Actinoplanes italicus]PRX25966.1 uncharacterized protein DUF3152 [Actinoplanes italicus]GIE33550.1 hypothetical protein Ait01nite_065950 [Actinoplanes italicus]
MANATNGPVDPDAATDRRGRAERSRADAAPAAPTGTPAATSPRRRTVAATATTGRAPVTAPAEPARRATRKTASTEEPARKPAGKKSTPAAGSAEPPAKPAAVKSTSARTSTGRAPARKTATAPMETVPEEPPARRRSTARTAPADGTVARRTTGSRTRRPESDPKPFVPALSEPENPEPPLRALPMTRGIFELAAERLAASTPRTVDPEPAAPADGDPLAAPGSYVNPRAAGGRRSHRSGGRPPEVARPEQDHWDGLSAENGWLGTPVDEPVPAVPEPEIGPQDEYPLTRNRPYIGLPPSVRLPAELPDNLWPPKSMLERNLTENIYVPAPVPPRVEEPPAPAHTPEPEPEREPAAETVLPEYEPEPDFLPAVLTHADHDYVPAHARSARPTGGQARHAVSETVGARRVRRRRRAVLVAYILVVVLVLIVGHELRNDEQPLAPGREAAQRAAEPAEVGPAAGPVPQAPQTTIAEPQKTGAADADEPAAKGKTGEFGYAKGRGPALGDGGRLYRFRVAVEKVVEDTSPGEFAEVIDETLGDERSWVNGGRLRLRRVPKTGDFDFTVYLASAKTSERMCASGGLDTEGYTSCRVPGQVIINADRWADAVPDYDGELEMYRRYTINHEVGHELGHGHEACPGKGEKAPVMQQQTFGLKGCTPNAWPYLDGKRYAGEPVA